MGHARIIGSTPEPHRIVSCAGRISSTEGTACALYERSAGQEEKNARLIGKILASGHSSVTEHAVLNLAFEDVSVFAEQFIIEFRLASFTVKSRRYVDFSAAGVYEPAFEGCAAGAREVFRRAVERLFALYARLEAAGVPKEDARFVLPYCFHSNFYCTLNARELMHMLNELAYGRGAAYPELRALGEELFAQCEERFPYLVRRERERYAAKLPDIPAARAQMPADAPLAEVLGGPEQPERDICRAAALMRGYQPAELDEGRQREFLRALLNAPRARELEQAAFTLRFGSLSLAALTHLTRHRMQSLCPPELAGCCSYERYVLPQSVLDAHLESEYRAAFALAGEAAEELRALGMSRADSVYLLLAGQTVSAVTTMNARELAVFMRLRCCERAQWEIRRCAEAALEALRERWPLLFSLYGPTCYMTGRCPEGAMSCGHPRSPEA